MIPKQKEYYIHSQALVETTEVGKGTRVWAFAHILKEAVIGRGCNIGDHCFIEGPQITPVPSPGATPAPSSGATGQAGQAELTGTTEGFIGYDRVIL